MNRRERRKQAACLKWGRVVPKGTYAELGDNDGRDLLVRVFRAIAREVSDEVFDDEALFNSTMLLIQHGLLSVWFAFDGMNVHVRTRLSPPTGDAA